MISYKAIGINGHPLQGTFPPDTISAAELDFVSLNLKPSEVARVIQDGADLKIVLMNGEEIVISGFFHAPGEVADVRLFLSAEGEAYEVLLTDEVRELRLMRYDDVAVSDILTFNEASSVDAFATLNSGAVTSMWPAVATLGLAAGGVAISMGGGSSAEGASVDARIDQLDDLVRTQANEGEPLVFSGTAKPGSTVVLDLEAEAYEVLVGGDGSWTIQVPAEDLPADGSYPLEFEVKDPSGSVQTVTGPNLIVDTTAPAFGSETISAVVREETGADQQVHTAKADGEDGVRYSIKEGVGDGHLFTIDSETGALRLGENPDFEKKALYSVDVVATDALGNSSVQTVNLRVESVPEIEDVSFSIGNGEGILSPGEVINVTVSFDEPVALDASGGAPVFNLTVGGLPRHAVYVSGAGTDELVFAYMVQSGDTENVGVSAPENALLLNGATLTGTVDGVPADITLAELPPQGGFLIDTTPPEATITGSYSGEFADDIVINVSDLDAGVVVRGVAEPGATITVELGGVEVPGVQIDAAGNWTAHFSAEALSDLESYQKVSATVRDAAGNETVVEGRSVLIDTTSPEEPIVSDLIISTGDNSVVGADIEDEAGLSFSFDEITGSGDVLNVGYTEIRSGFEFDRDLPDGSSLIVTATEETSGNEASTLLVWHDGAMVDAGDDAMDGFNVEAIDLNYADGATATLTSEDFRNLVGAGGDLLILGGADDAVEVEGMASTGQVETVNGQNYAIYQLAGFDGRLLVDTDIDDVTIGVS